MNDQDQMLLATNALHHLEICFDEALDDPIFCPSCNTQLYEDCAPRVAPTDGGVMCFLVCAKCDTRLAKGPIKRPACLRKPKPGASCLIECTPAETPAMIAELELWLRMEGE